MKTISDGAVKLLQEYAARGLKGIGTDPLLTAVYSNGVEDGVTILAEQILEQIEESER